MKISKASFGFLPDGREVFLYTIENSNGIKIQVSDYGANLVSLVTPDRAGNFADVVLGYDDLAGYQNDQAYLGATVGRCCNRVVNASFDLDGQKIQLSQNNEQHHLHGGFEGFNKKLWHSMTFEDLELGSVLLNYKSEAGEEGYPGNLNVVANYTLTDDDELHISYAATTDAATVVNITNHSYFNLTGRQRDVLGHQLQVFASQYTRLDERLLPTGEIVNVADGPLDFRKPKTIGHDFAEVGIGYDRNFVLEDATDSLSLSAHLIDPDSGRAIDFYTEEPGMQLYTGNYLDGTIGKNNVPMQQHWGLCLETQHLPDSPNHANFPSIVLRPGEQYKTMTVLKIRVER